MANCLSPTGTVGKVIFDRNTNTMQYCNGSSWIGFPKNTPACLPVTNFTTSTANDARTFSGLIFVNNLFYASTSDGIYSSPDGLTWTQRFADGGPVSNITYGNGRFVAVQATWWGRTVTSTDGITWTGHMGALPVSDWIEVFYGNGTFIATSRSGANRVATSTDGINWTLRTPPADEWGAGAYGNGRHVAVAINWDATNPAIVSTNNGATWTAVNTGNSEFRDITFANGLFVAVGSAGKIYTSPDGTSWTERVAPSGGNVTLQKVIHTGSQFLAIGGDPWVLNASVFTTSTDGINWTTSGANPIGINWWSGLAVGNNRVLGLSEDGTGRTIYTSCAASVCSPISGLTPSTVRDASSFTDIVYANNMFVASTDSDGIWTSPDGQAWTQRFNDGPVSAIEYSNGLFVGVQQYVDGSSYTSPDGINWTRHNNALPSMARWGMTSGAGVFVAINWDGNQQISTSTDGINWTLHDTTGDPEWLAGAYGNGRFVVTTHFGDSRIRYSDNNGATWSLYDTGVLAHVSSVIFVNGQFVATGNYGRIWTSPDGLTWTLQTTGNANNWQRVVYTGNQYIVLGSDQHNNYMTSPNAITWTTQALPGAVTPNRYWTGLAAGGGNVVGVSFDGTNKILRAYTGCVDAGNCSNPVEPAGTMMYNNDRHVMQWCDGILWHGMGPDNPAAGPGCTSPGGQNGDLIYNADARVPQYCGNGRWYAVGKVCEPHECGLVHHWNLDETTVTNGSVITDSIGGLHGTVTGTLNAVAGKNGGGILFNADNEFISGMGTLAALNNQTTFTISAWIKRNSVGSTVMVGSYVANTSGAYINTWNDGMMYFGVGNTATGATDDEAYYPLNNTSWHLMTLVYNGSLATNSNRLRTYVDGVAVTPNGYSGTIPATSVATQPFAIGHVIGTGYYSRGTIDDVRIYNRALSAAEVAALYAATNDSCSASNIVPGAVCLDGSVYAGLSPDGNVPMYTTPANAGARMPWNNGNSSGYVNTPVTDCIDYLPSTASSCWTGEANTATLIATDSDSGVGGVQPHQAAQYCADLVAHGFDDWYLPAQDEMYVLYNNRTSIGGFPTEYYWVSSEVNNSVGRAFDFINGNPTSTTKNTSGSPNGLVRCVRK